MTIALGRRAQRYLPTVRLEDPKVQLTAVDEWPLASARWRTRQRRAARDATSSEQRESDRSCTVSAHVTQATPPDLEPPDTPVANYI